MNIFDWKSPLYLAPLVAMVHPVYAVDYLSVSEAQKILFPKADRFTQQKIELTDQQMEEIKEISGTRQRNKNPQIWFAYFKKNLLGWFLIDEVIGKHEFITYATALTPDGKVIGIEIMSYRETHGGEVRKVEWRDQFKGKTAKDPFKLDVDVTNISGATLSSRNLLDGVKRLLILQQALTPKKNN